MKHPWVNVEAFPRSALRSPRTGPRADSGPDEPLANRAYLRLNHVRRPRRVDDNDLLRPAAGFAEKALAHALVIGGAAAFQAIGLRLASQGGLLHGHVEHERQIGLQSLGGQQANLPKLLGVE